MSCAENYNSILVLGIVATLTDFVCTGCSPDHTDADLKHCVAEGTKDYPADSTMTEEQRQDAIGDEAKDCMKALGYRQDTSNAKCLDNIESTSACYVMRRDRKPIVSP